MSATAENKGFDFDLDSVMDLIMEENKRIKDTKNTKAYHANCDYVLEKAALL